MDGSYAITGVASSHGRKAPHGHWCAQRCPDMKLAEIRRAVDEGLRVHWQNQGYEVVRSSGLPSYLIRSNATGHCIGLTWADGVTLNGKEEDFFIGDPALT